MFASRRLTTVLLCVVFGMTSCQSQGKRQVINGPEDLTDQQRRDIATIALSVSPDEVLLAFGRLRETVLRDGAELASLPALGIEVDETTDANCVRVRHDAKCRPLFLGLVIRNGRIKGTMVKS